MGRGGEPGLMQCFSLSGWIKILESCSVFTCLMLHRIGNRGDQIFYGASDEKLDNADLIYPMEADAEILGGCVMAFTIITPLILLAYAVEGTEAVQSTSMDAIFCFVGAIMLIATGGMTCFAWNNANRNNGNLTRRDFEAAGALGVMCIGTGVVYFLDFFWVMYRKAFLGEAVAQY